MINSVMLNNGNVTTFTVNGLDGYVLEMNSGEGTEIITDIVLLKDEKAYFRIIKEVSGRPERTVKTVEPSNIERGNTLLKQFSFR